MTSPPDAPDPLDAKATRRGWMAVFGLSLGTALLIVSPFFWRGTASGHDIAFHASSWLDVAGQWKEGIAFPRWCEWANNGFGEPRFIFYPPLSWLLGAALGFVVPWNAVPGTFIVLVQTLAGVSMFALARRFFPAGAALFAAACYTANPYALLVVYMRSDCAEELAWAFLPAFLLAALQLSGLMENRWGSGPRSAAIFGLFFAAKNCCRPRSRAPAVINFWAVFRRHLACECAGRRFGQLQHGASLCVGGVIRKVFPALIARSRRSGPGIWVGLLLSRAGSLRTKMGEHWRGAFLRVAACGELSVHQDCGSGA